MIMADFVLNCGDWCKIQRFCVNLSIFFAKQQNLAAIGAKTMEIRARFDVFMLICVKFA